MSSNKVDKKQPIRYNTLIVLYVVEKAIWRKGVYGRKEKHIDL